MENEIKQKIAVHGYVCMGDRLFVSCHSLQVERKDLGTEDLDEAKQKAIAFLREKLQERIAGDRTALMQIEYAEKGYLLDRIGQASAGMVIIPGVWERANV